MARALPCEDRGKCRERPPRMSALTTTKRRLWVELAPSTIGPSAATSGLSALLSIADIFRNSTSGGAGHRRFGRLTACISSFRLSNFHSVAEIHGAARHIACFPEYGCRPVLRRDRANHARPRHCCRGSLGGTAAPSRSSRRQRQPWRKCDCGWRGRRGNSDRREVAQRGSPPNAVFAPKPSGPRHWLFPRIRTSKGSLGTPRTNAARRVEGQSREEFLRTLGFWRGVRERVFLPHAVLNLSRGSMRTPIGRASHRSSGHQLPPRRASAFVAAQCRQRVESCSSRNDRLRAT